MKSHTQVARPARPGGGLRGSVRSHVRLVRRRTLGVLCIGALLVGTFFAQGARGEDTSHRPLLLKGRWIVDGAGRATPPGSFTRGLQTSGLVYHRGLLLSVGDQRSAFPAHLLVISPKTARFTQTPVPLRLSRDLPDTPTTRSYRGVVNPDFEGLTVHPRAPETLLLVTEDKTPLLATVRLEWSSEENPPRLRAAKIVVLTPLVYPAGLKPWRGDTNFRLEGCTTAPGRDRLYVAFERAADDLPRLLGLPLGAADATPATLEELSIDFSSVPRRPDKKRARLNINGVVELPRRGLVVAVARDQERVLFLDPASAAVRHTVDLDLRTPQGKRIQWVSPEGVAAHPATGRLWIVNDPDSMRGNYRARNDRQASGRFAQFAPLLFELPLDRVLPAE